ncbi:hypothetical protein HXX76_009827 [Chlamydomonas incerta]|uniref:Uncharacterized protein n=1 Tax=Chlamydomonas incerta TaxID=51695 RepID=A0A835SPJ9_CHLIN|nr:hypothetical protein HXX76_009827 [Chlamydomonas incerta]|eukprot:KAG2430853.1 hypothetical protein HXX76_009827 [Chlamydomonas incerta]
MLRPQKFAVEPHADASGFWHKLTFGFINGLLLRASKSADLGPRDAAALLPPSDEAHRLAQQFDSAYAGAGASQGQPGVPGSPWTTPLFLTLLRLHWRAMLWQQLLCTGEVAQALVTPVLLREFLRWLEAATQGPDGSGDGGPPPVWRGWVFAVALGLSGISIPLMMHHHNWSGVRMALCMRQQAISAIHSKILRMTASPGAAATTTTGGGSSSVSAGYVSTLIGADVRRFDDALKQWPYLVASPLQLIAVIVMVGLELDFVSAVAGASVSIALIPLQAALAGYISELRGARARCTDERVRLMAEVVDGHLAVKMCGLEDSFQVRIKKLRKAEERQVRRASRIRAFNLALYTSISSIIAFVTFSVHRARGGSLNVASVFYALSLLQLPAAYLVYDFVTAAQYATELGVSITRIQAFLSLPEPPPPQSLAPLASTSSAAAAGLEAAPRSPSPPRSSELHAPPAASQSGAAKPLGPSPPRLEPPPLAARALPSLPDVGRGGHVAMHGGDFDWRCPLGRQDLEPSAEVLQLLAAAPEDDDEYGGITVVAVEAAAPVVVVSDPAPVSATLSGVRFSCAPSELLGVCGATGSGKSTLLAALLGQLQPLQQQHAEEGTGDGGGVQLRGSVAYCAQVPWIMAGSVRDNITFGLPYEQEWYDAVVSACCLPEDLARMAAGDLTELGEGGAGLSGGQKARVALARACYCRPDVALLDDPLSAVDARVGLQLFERVLGPAGLMAVRCGTTRLLVTHQEQFLPLCDRVLLLRGGRQAALGPWSEVQQLRREPLALAPAAGASAAAESAVSTPVTVGTATADAAVDSGADAGGANDSSGEQRGSMGRARTVIAGWVGTGGRLTMWGGGGGGGDRGAPDPAGSDADDESLKRPPAGASLLASEDKETGAVSWSVYGRYVRCLGLGLTAVVLLALLAGEAAYLAADWWLALWAAEEPAQQAEPRWQITYAILTAVVVLLAVARFVIFFEASVSAATGLHNKMLKRVLRAPLSFFHSNPAGRIINRFSKDQGLVDDLLPAALGEVLDSGMLVVGALVLVAVAVPLVLPLFIPLAVAFLFVRRRYITASREVRRWEAVTYSPIYTFVAATCKGLPTIRAYGAGERFQQELLRLLSLSAEWSFASNAGASWISLRLDTISAVTLLLAAVMAVLVRDRINVEVLALALTHSLSLTHMMQFFVQQSAEVENHMTSVERLLAYTELDSEPPRVAEGGGQPPAGWPRTGALHFQDVSAAYQPGLPPVLRGVTFSVPAGSSCGVVGRTGSGKSSLLLTLFRMVELTHGSILLDGVDIAAVGLDALRRHLAVIPQDPVLFGGSLRINLDPWGAHSSNDAELWAVLRSVRLAGAVSALPGGLDAQVAAGGANLSAGQRQLLCLARAMLQRAKVLALDEATANVDAETDEAVQAALRESLQGACAVGGGAESDGGGIGSGGGGVALVIAHRLDTVMDLDALLVLAEGRVEEWGPPRQLLRGGGSLWHMAAAAAESPSVGNGRTEAEAVVTQGAQGAGKMVRSLSDAGWRA